MQPDDEVSLRISAMLLDALRHVQGDDDRYMNGVVVGLTVALGLTVHDVNASISDLQDCGMSILNGMIDDLIASDVAGQAEAWLAERSEE